MPALPGVRRRLRRHLLQSNAGAKTGRFYGQWQTAGHRCPLLSAPFNLRVQRWLLQVLWQVRRMFLASRAK